MRAQGADSGASSNSTTAVIEDKVATLSLSEDGRARERKSGADKVNLTDEEAAALQELLDVGGDERDGGQSADEPGATDGADGQAGDGKSREPGQRQPRLERQVFVGGLPVDVTSTLFRTWADQVFHGRVINAVLVVDRLTHSRSRGFGFITFDSVEVAEEAARQRMFSFGERMVEVKRAQNLNANRKQAQNQVADSRAKPKIPPLNGRSSRFNAGRGGLPPVAVGGRGVAAPPAPRGMANRPSLGQAATPGANTIAPTSPHQYPAVPPNHAKIHASKTGPGAGMGMVPPAPQWSGPPVPGPAGRGPHFQPGMGPDPYHTNMERAPAGARSPQGVPPGWFTGAAPGMTPEQQMMAAGGYAFFYPVYPAQGRGAGMMPPPAVPHGPYAPPWPMAGDGMMPPFMPGAGPHGLFYGPIPPGMEMAMMGMHPGFMGVPDAGMPDGGMPEDGGVPAVYEEAAVEEADAKDANDANTVEAQSRPENLAAPVAVHDAAQ